MFIANKGRQKRILQL